MPLRSRLQARARASEAVYRVKYLPRTDRTPPPRSTMGESFKDPNMKQALTPYHPLAIRNRLPVVFDNAPIPRARFCFPRNNHTYDFFKAGNTPAGFQTYRTTNGNFYGNDTRVLDVGDNNAGIVVRACPIAPACGVFGCPTVALQSAGYPRLKLLISFT